MRRMDGCLLHRLEPRTWQTPALEFSREDSQSLALILGLLAGRTICETHPTQLPFELHHGHLEQARWTENCLVKLGPCHALQVG